MKVIKRVTALAAALCIAVAVSGCGKEVKNKSDAPTDTAPAANGGFNPGEGIINSDFGTLTEFSAQTLNGDTVTQEIFSENDLTMIYIWKTDCEPCKAEFPALVKLSGMLPEGTALIGMCIDGDTNGDEAKKIADEAGLPFDSIIGGATLEGVKSTPTTMYVDKYGNVVGEPKEGRSYASDDDAAAQEFFIDVSSHLGMAKSKYQADARKE